MNAVLNWVKSNIYIVIFVVVMIAAPVALTIVGSSMNRSVREKVAERAKALGLLHSIDAQFSIEIPFALSANGKFVVNEPFIERFEAILATVKGDAGQVGEKALTFNRKDRGLLIRELFPEPPVHERETLPPRMYRALIAAYQGLLAQMDAGTPPSPAEVQEELKGVQERTINKEGAALGAEEQAALTEQLTRTRLGMYADAAKRIKVYASLASLNVPAESEIPARAEDAALVDLFNWQWDFWVKQDISGAVRAANESSDSVLDAPVKRLVSVTVYDAPQVSASSGAGAPPASGGFGVSGGGAGNPGKRGAAEAPKSKPPGGARGGGADAPAKPAPPAAPVINLAAEVRPDYSVSFTGRRSNPIYDVRHVSLDLIVATAAAPAVLDALSRQNLITILDVDLSPVNVFDDIRDGFFYGPDPVSHLTLELETVWLRGWTMPLMPAPLREALAAGTMASAPAAPGSGRSGSRRGAADEEEEEEGDE